MSDKHAQWGYTVPGLPEGAIIDKVGIGKCGPQEFEFYGTRIVKGPRAGVQVVVKPADGYRFDLRIETQDYIPVKV